ncbi:MAG: SGNH/GDSL hydrolase family protein [Deltaproteobacteria bacterium]|nr:SGNH/GDSL hydrolase family protein [Deltaproteobacteria bacterium]
MRRLRDVGVAVAILVALEALVRLLGLGRAVDDTPVRFVNEESGWARAGVYYEIDPELFWRLRPSAEIVGGLYRTNSLGLRGPEIEAPKPARTFRIALVGDSCTFGLGLDLPDTYGAMLETLEGPDGERVETVRLAVPGYSSLQSLWLAERILPRLEADAVVLYVGAFNDAAPACGATDAEIARSMATVGLRTVLGRLALYRALAGLVRDAPPRCPPPDPEPRVDLEGFSDNLDRLVRVARHPAGRRRSPPGLVVVVPPVVPQAPAEPYGDAVARIRGAVAPRLAGGDFQPDRIHPNRSGNVEIARRLAPSLRLRGELDPREVADARSADAADDLMVRAEPQRARDLFGDLAARHPDRPRLAIAFVRATLAIDAAAALPIAADAVRRHPRVTDLRRLYAEALAASGDDAAAEGQMRAGLASDRGWIYGRVVLARSLLARGDRAGARRQALRGLAVAPTSRELREIERATR